MSLPVIDIAPLFAGGEREQDRVARKLAAACESKGFFYVSGHTVPAETVERLTIEAQAFFALPPAEKRAIAMADKGVAAWRGWFPLGGELTSGVPDDKEGLYFGEDLPVTDPRVRSQWPMHGANLWPEGRPGLRRAVEEYMAAAEHTAAALVAALGRALGVSRDVLTDTYLARPTKLFRIFHYPPTAHGGWGVGEHTDYGLLTLLTQDDAGGLEVRTPEGWETAWPIAGAIVCNVGDMLERITGGRFIAAPHRVFNASGRERLSFPFFYDPDFTAPMRGLPGVASVRTARGARWDAQDLRSFDGCYGDWLLAKVGRVFPDLTSPPSERRS